MADAVTIDLSDKTNKKWLHPTGKPVKKFNSKEENKFNPSQPRDDFGRWLGEGGVGGGSGFTTARSAGGDKRQRIENQAKDMVDKMTPDNEYLGEKLPGIGKDLGLQVARGPIKKPARMVDKTIEELGGDVYAMKDVVRGTMILQNTTDKNRAIERIKQDFEIARIKDLNAGGYSDTKVNIKMPHSGLVGEIILITPEMYNAKAKPTLYKESGHQLYDTIRSSSSSPKDVELAATKTEKIYAAATTKYEARVREGGTMDIPYLVNR